MFSKGYSVTDWIKDKVQSGLYRRKRDSEDVWAIKARIKGGNPLTLTIGKVNLFTPQEARNEAKKILALLAQGINPTEERNKKKRAALARTLTLENAINDYAQIASWKKKTRDDALNTLKRRFGDWYNKPISSITKENIQTRFLKIKKDVSEIKSQRDKKRSKNKLPIKVYGNEVGLGEAQRAFRYLSAIFNSYSQDDAGEEKLLPNGNPCLILKVKKLRKSLKPRDRFLDEDQRQTLYSSLSVVGHKNYLGNVKEDDRDLIWLLIHTGLRLDEALSMKWEAVDFKKETFTAFDTKNHRNHTLPMTNATLSMFSRRWKNAQSKYVFPSEIKPKEAMTASRIFSRVSKEVGFEFTAHDLRRTVATVASDLGYDINTIGMILNHSKGSVTSKYIQSTHKRLKDILINIQNTLFGQSYD